MNKILHILCLMTLLWSCNMKVAPREYVSSTPFLNEPTNEIDSVIVNMSTDEKISQLLIAHAITPSKAELVILNRLVANEQISGLLLEGASVTDWHELQTLARKDNELPFIMATQSLNSLHNQFKTAADFPSFTALNAIGDFDLKGQLERDWLAQVKLMDINMVIGPNLIEYDTSNTIFNSDIVELDPLLNELKAARLLDELQAEQILTIGNDFHDLVYIENDTLEIVDSLLYKYTSLIDKGLSGLRIGDELYQEDSMHLELPDFVKSYVQERLHYNGLIVSMQSEATSFEEMLHTGTDLFIVKQPDLCRLFLKGMVEKEMLSLEDLDNKVRKVLLAKQWMNGGTMELPETSPDAKFNSRMADYFNHKDWHFYTNELVQKSAVLVNNHAGLLPFTHTYHRPFKVYHYAPQQHTSFNVQFKKYANFRSYFDSKISLDSIPSLVKPRAKNQTIIVSLEGVDLQGVDNQYFVNSINQLAKQNQIAVINFGNPKNIIPLDTAITFLQLWDASQVSQKLAAQMLFGAERIEGHLPMTINNRYPKGTGYTTTKTRLQYGVPQSVGISPAKLKAIDQVARTAISKKAFPGCQVLVAKSGQVIYNKSFGYHTYDKKQKVRSSDIFDLASLTKVAATTPAIMRMYQNNQLRLDTPLKEALELPKFSTLKNIKIKNLLIHKSRIQANMPIAKYINKDDVLKMNCLGRYCAQKSEAHKVLIANKIYMNSEEQDKIWKSVNKLKKMKRKSFRYSDVNFYLLQKIVEERSNTSLDQYVNTNFYNRLGLRRFGFKPLDKYSPNIIIPTVNDERWRMQQLDGHVHDEAAALMGGVAGNAGLFGNAEDLAVIFQMFLQNGIYGNKQYFNRKTIKLFTRNGHGNHRGLGFDKPSWRKSPSYAGSAPKSTFGHTGFTGTCVWADPDNDLIFILLSNRIYGDVKNTKMFRLKTRRKMHQAIYNALDSYEMELPSLPERR